VDEFGFVDGVGWWYDVDVFEFFGLDFDELIGV